MRKLHVWADQIGFTDSERYELATYLLRRDITSWSQLTEADENRLLDAFEGYHLIDTLVSLRPPQQVAPGSR